LPRKAWPSRARRRSRWLARGRRRMGHRARQRGRTGDYTVRPGRVPCAMRGAAYPLYSLYPLRQRRVPLSGV